MYLGGPGVLVKRACIAFSSARKSALCIGPKGDLAPHSPTHDTRHRVLCAVRIDMAGQKEVYTAASEVSTSQETLVKPIRSWQGFLWDTWDYPTQVSNVNPHARFTKAAYLYYTVEPKSS